MSAAAGFAVAMKVIPLDGPRQDGEEVGQGQARFGPPEDSVNDITVAGRALTPRARPE